MKQAVLTLYYPEGQDKIAQELYKFSAKHCAQRFIEKKMYSLN